MLEWPEWYTCSQDKGENRHSLFFSEQTKEHAPGTFSLSKSGEIGCGQQIRDFQVTKGILIHFLSRNEACLVPSSFFSRKKYVNSGTAMQYDLLFEKLEMTADRDRDKEKTVIA